MLNRNEKEIEQIYSNNKEIALLYRNDTIIYDKRVDDSVKLTYISENQNYPFLEVSERGGSATFTVTSSEPTWINHLFLGWSPREHDYTILYHDGDSITINQNTVLYAVWSVSFQGLIDEGYVTIENATPTSRGIALTVSHNCPYPKNKVWDFNDVFYSISKVSMSGVVGEGTLGNVFLWPTSHWLTDNEVYDLYNNVQLTQDVVGLQFRFLNWKHKNSFTIKYVPSDKGYYYTDSGIFGPNMPETINFNVGNRWFSSTHEMFGRHNKSGDNVWIPMSNTVNFNWITTRDGGYNYMNDASGMFELASKLKTVTGLNFRNVRNVQNTFDGCRSLVTVPSDWASPGMNNLTTMGECFRNCVSLTSIVPVMNVENVSSNANVFQNDSALTSIRLYHINAIKNKDWHLEDTNLDQTSIDYIITNVYENVDTSAEGFTYRNIYFPSGANISYDQYARLYEYGWNVYLGSEPYPIAI